MLRATAAFLFLTLLFSPAHAELTGKASVIDGDTLEIHGQRIRLHGIDAPESGQFCEAGGKSYRCGREAAWELDRLIANRTTHCQQRDIDRYSRIVAECFVGGINLNAAMVQTGWALAYRRYSKDYIQEEDLARQQEKGVWAGTFIYPWDYRRGKTTRAIQRQQEQSGSCQIKGNINNKGDRIYHIPGSRWYKQTQINTAKGERWFCSESEAQNAGWRKPR